MVELALGNFQKAANKVEMALARLIPIVIGFLASLLGIGGIANKIRSVGLQAANGQPAAEPAQSVAAERGADLFVRRIPGLNAIEEAVGRATEMGKPILFSFGLGYLTDMVVIAAELAVRGKTSPTQLDVGDVQKAINAKGQLLHV